MKEENQNRPFHLCSVHQDFSGVNFVDLLIKFSLSDLLIKFALFELVIYCCI